MGSSHLQLLLGIMYFQTINTIGSQKGWKTNISLLKKKLKTQILSVAVIIGCYYNNNH